MGCISAKKQALLRSICTILAEIFKWIHKATFQGYQPAIDYCKEHGYKWY